MLAEFGCRYVIVGHSERRALHGESDALVAEKAQGALAHGLTPIVCVGETLAEREAGETEAVVERQLGAAIDTARRCASATSSSPTSRCGRSAPARPRRRPRRRRCMRFLRAQLRRRERGEPAPLRILYGGSVKPDNAAQLFAQPDIDGGLIGGASLKAADFIAICRAAALSARRTRDHESRIA